MTDNAQQLTISVLPPSLDHPEDVAWGPDGRVYAGGESRQVYRINLTDNSCENPANCQPVQLESGISGDGDSRTAGEISDVYDVIALMNWQIAIAQKYTTTL